MKNSSNLKNIKAELRKSADSEKINSLQRFFKTGPGEYGEGDVFIGLSSADQKRITRQFYSLSLEEIESLLQEKIHEYRSTALSILVLQYQKGGEQERKKIFDLYCRNLDKINNWDLVDTSAYKIIGHYLSDKPRDFLYRSARSENLWLRRISIVSTFAFIRNNDFKDTLKIAGMLINDEHDLIHKAVGWMLREVGKRDLSQEVKFLEKYYRFMPRTMLRYAIERFPTEKRAYYMKK